MFSAKSVALEKKIIEKEKNDVSTPGRAVKVMYSKYRDYGLSPGV